ncbi:hypothetical protein Ddye_023773 [Dipteronia dyeriana]|uniref:At2g29880-like C-terminal domain-containing protein n=1 Tax=Dipteronia dyeriana TaxID=168575 RepID=A0AAD9TUI1_9ROSI|nr:hypothetical protein Ddye_023773 [Dipteronia dyeriana]
MLLQLMVDVASHGLRDANGMLSKAIVDSRILLLLNEKLGCQKTHNNFMSRLKFFKREYQKYSQLMRHSSGFGTFGVEERHFALDNFVYDDANEAFVPNQNEQSHQPLPLGQSSSPLPFPATSSEVHPVSTSQKKRTRTDNEWNGSSSETNNKAGIMEKISLSIDSIATNFWGVHSLLEKREKDREKNEMEKREKERQNCIWDAIKETPNLDKRTRYKAIALLTNKTKKEEFLKMSHEEHSNWITYNLE